MSVDRRSLENAAALVFTLEPLTSVAFEAQMSSNSSLPNFLAVATSVQVHLKCGRATAVPFATKTPALGFFSMARPSLRTHPKVSGVQAFCYLASHVVFGKVLESSYGPSARVWQLCESSFRIKMVGPWDYI